MKSTTLRSKGSNAPDGVELQQARIVAERKHILRRQRPRLLRQRQLLDCLAVCALPHWPRGEKFERMKQKSARAQKKTVACSSGAVPLVQRPAYSKCLGAKSVYIML